MDRKKPGIFNFMPHVHLDLDQHSVDVSFEPLVYLMWAFTNICIVLGLVLH
jgi:hypothetical protein